MAINRRRFLSQSLVLSSSAWLACHRTLSRAATRPERGRLASIVIDHGENALVRLDLRTGKKSILKLPMAHPHGLVQENDTIFLISKHGHQIGKIDHQDRMHVISEDVQFGGHAALSEDKKLLFVTVIESEARRGYVSVRSASNLAEVDRWLPTLRSPHDIHLISQTKKLVVADYGTKNAIDPKGGLVLADASSGKMSEFIPGFTAQSAFSHIGLSKTGDLAAAGLTYGHFSKDDLKLRRQGHESDVDFEPSLTSSPILFLRSERKAEYWSCPENVSQMIYPQSITICDRTSVLAASYHNGRALCFWDTKVGRDLHSEQFTQGVRGIALNLAQTYFFVHLFDGSLMRFDSKTLQREILPMSFRTSKTSIVSAHLFFLS